MALRHAFIPAALAVVLTGAGAAAQSLTPQQEAWHGFYREHLERVVQQTRDDKPRALQPGECYTLADAVEFSTGPNIGLTIAMDLFTVIPRKGEKIFNVNGEEMAVDAHFNDRAAFDALHGKAMVVPGLVTVGCYASEDAARREQDALNYNVLRQTMRFVTDGLRQHIR